MEERGCAVNADGTLKDASEIQWNNSRSPSPDLSAIPEPMPLANPSQSPLLVRPAPHEDSTDLEKPRKKRQKENPRRPLTSAQPPKKLRVNLTYHDKIKIMEYAEGDGQGLSQSAIARKFHHLWPTLSQDNVSKILKNREALKHLRDQDQNRLAFKRPANFKFPDLEAALTIWFNNKQDTITMTTAVIRMKALDLGMSMGIAADKILQFSSGWADSFMLRHNISQMFRHGEAATVTPEAVSLARKQVIEILSNCKLSDVYNIDETALFYRMLPNKTLANQLHSGVKNDKVRMTFALISNADGSDMRRPLIIGHARKPRCFQKREARDFGFYYFWNKTAWMETSIWLW